MNDLHPELKEKINLLELWFRQRIGSMVAFSGGIDSTLVLFLARKFQGRDRTIGVISNSESLKNKDFRLAQSFCEEFDIQLHVIKTNELADSRYNENPINRCFFCKDHLFHDLQELKKEYPGFEILSGTNFDDLGDYRPGMDAAQKNQVLSPLVDCKMTKEQIREIARHFNLPNWNKPASPCLSSRIPYNQAVTLAKLKQIEAAEDLLNSYGFEDVRVRHYGTYGKIEVKKADLDKLLPIRDQVIGEIKQFGFNRIEIDEEGLVSGKMNRGLKLEDKKKIENMRILYYDCFAGISGDMNLGAMIDLGVDPDYLKAELQKLNIEGFHLEVQKDIRRGISGTKATVVIGNPENEKHRHLRHVEELVNQSSLSDAVKSKSLQIFDLIAVAEAKVHDISKERVHFHEVGALDSIADIVGAAICLEYLKVDKVMSSSIQLGGGMVKCAHGIMPVPAPATALIVQNVPVRSGLVKHEATTPTGAAILVAMVDEFNDRIDFQIKKTAYGIGQRDVSEVPNVLRVFLSESSKVADNTTQEEAWMVECNIDDMNPEWYEHLIGKLLEAGASDVFLTPIIMKKSRPANTLSVLCNRKIKPGIKSIIFRNSTTIGVREYAVSKTVLERQEKKIETELGKIAVKYSYFEGQEIRFKPESDEINRLATEHGLSLNEVEKIITKGR